MSYLFTIFVNIRSIFSPNIVNKSSNRGERGGPGNKAGPENKLAPGNKLGPVDKVGPGNAVGPGNHVGPGNKVGPIIVIIFVIYDDIYIYIYCLLAIAYCPMPIVYWHSLSFIPGVIRITKICGSNLRHADIFDQSDPYMKFEMANRQYDPQGGHMGQL